MLNKWKLILNSKYEYVITLLKTNTLSGLGIFSIKNIFRLIGWVLGIVGFVAIVLALFVDTNTLYDRYCIADEPPQLSEYIFGSQYYYVQALVNNENKVIAYGVTSRTEDFSPEFEILEGLYFLDTNNPLDFSKQRSGKKTIVLGKTKFADIEDEPDDFFGFIGAHDIYYHEENYYGNPGSYLGYFFAVNESGYLSIDSSSLFFYDTKKADIHSTKAKNFRKRSSINTFYVSAPFEAHNNKMMRKYLVGPDKYQMRVLNQNAIMRDLSITEQVKAVTNLSTTVDINHFIETLGSPIIINEKPTFDIREDLPLNHHSLQPEHSLINEYFCNFIE